jgi:hypothetical protein
VEYEMVYAGGRRDVPSSVYGNMIGIIELTGWTLEQIADAPADLIDELQVMLQKRALRQESNAG